MRASFFNLYDTPTHRRGQLFPVVNFYKAVEKAIAAVLLAI
jgi:hypothetical protein